MTSGPGLRLRSKLKRRPKYPVLSTEARLLAGGVLTTADLNEASRAALVAAWRAPSMTLRKPSKETADVPYMIWHRGTAPIHYRTLKEALAAASTMLTEQESRKPVRVMRLIAVAKNRGVEWETGDEEVEASLLATFPLMQRRNNPELYPPPLSPNQSLTIKQNHES